MSVESQETKDSVSPSRFSFIRHGVDEFGSIPQSDFHWDQCATSVRKSLKEALSARNISFLMGAGCSSFISENIQVGIPTMLPLAKEFIKSIGDQSQDFYVTRDEYAELKDWIGIDIAASKFANNLEKLMEVLHAFRFAYSETNVDSCNSDNLLLIDRTISKVQSYILHHCTEGEFSQGDSAVLSLYQLFYKKLLFRDRSLPRPWVFTTNYDLFNETALDYLGLPYANGFSGFVQRRFNPATFRLALAEQLDISNRRWTAVDGFIYLAKLHGSISWTEDDHGLFPIRESVPPRGGQRILIYPTPAKQRASLSSPYSDLFREFQMQIVQEQSILFTLGYSFGDEHINNIIYQALTIPTFRLVIFADPTMSGPIQMLQEMADPRVWIIGGGGKDTVGRAHYFESFVRHFMPEDPSSKVDDAIKSLLHRIAGMATDQ